jgi:hypothetical protein
MKPLTQQQREMVAAFLIDRADQYDTKSSSWIPLADAAHDVMSGDMEQRAREGEFDDALLKRVRKWGPTPSSKTDIPATTGKE